MYTCMAKPQTNGVDTQELQRIDHIKYGWAKSSATTSVTLCNNMVDVYAGTSPSLKTIGMGPDARHATDNEMTLSWAAELHPYIAAWADGYYALSHYLDEFWAWNSLSGQGSSGCMSGHVNMKEMDYCKHAVYVTIYDFNGTAQGIYHEYAHLRLETLGIQIEEHDYTLLLNEPSELYDSSVRHDKKRPMSAVLHGVYAWLMFTENDWQLYNSGVTTRDTFTSYSKHNVAKIKTGVQEIKNYGRFTKNGIEFIGGLYEWSDDLCARCEQEYR